MDIRWKQRFENFEKAFLVLQRTVHLENLNEAERGGLIQFYEMAFELAWKLLRDYLETEGFTVKSPRDAIKVAVQYSLITNAHDWIDALDDRNLTAHTYDEETAIEVTRKIKSVYYIRLSELHSFFKEKIS